MDQPTDLGNDEAESLWRQHGVIIDLYKFFFEWVLKLGIFYYAITGAILSYCLSRPDEDLVRYSLLLPVVLSLFLRWLFVVGQQGLAVTQQQVYAIEAALKPEPKLRLDISFLPKFLAVNAVMCTLIAVTLLVLTFALPYIRSEPTAVQRFSLSGDCEVTKANTREAPIARIVCR